MHATIYLAKSIEPLGLAKAFAAATGTPLATVALVNSDDPAGAVDAWGDAEIVTTLRYWKVGGEFPFAVQVLVKPPISEDDEPNLPILQRVTTNLHQPVLIPEELAQVLAIFPDGSTLLLDEEDQPDDEAIILKPRDYRRYVEHAARLVAA